MKRKSTIAAFVVLGMATLLGLGARAQQPSQPAKQAVPNNLAPHPAPAQPIAFSHKLHITRGLQCKDCHANPDPGNQMTMPVASACMTCHVAVATDKPPIRKLAEAAKSNQAIAWARVYQLTPGVTWTHRAHLKAGLQCVMCHGEVGQLDAMAQTTSVTAMGVCIGCHQTKGAATACSTCHSWPGNVPSSAKSTPGAAPSQGDAALLFTRIARPVPVR